ncbi:MULTISPECIES: protein-L-isoaspartate O-methyltransferase [unclassified Methylophilus]|jgi:protein-L-isoaspartate(D-aspartate) O-methyltransferase|uniref:protein-L-isoaspartate O-methyltransferase family protein n=1 Tax=unclassified Methylophilus TaxID=2630143 RepID=UPI0006FD648C|nr:MULTISPECIES: protein-L-isoaspartate O-methyltransferase [unclassified Methylophilus]KQT42631.1 protein-L-isoaspartate O-methyltransferase [Methylophilus sp. Leaf416]KQT56815.1 protein-L-isoaspartate O-methyltransferase [Methylophilus sp. Leaf459]
MTDQATARFNMIEQQIRTWEVLDPKVLATLNSIPRENFVPDAYRGLAFADIEIPLAHDQQMLSPKVEGRFLQALQLQATDKVLLIGAGSGYLAALMAQHAAQVTALEIFPDLCELASQNLSKQGIQNVQVIEADGHSGLESNAPFDAIVFTASSPVEAEGVRRQLSIGGRMLIVLGKAPVMQATLIQRLAEHSYKQDVLFETSLTEMQNAPQAQAFSF